MKNGRIVSIMLILVSLAVLLVFPAQVLAADPISTEDAIYKANPVYPADAVYSLAAAPKPISDPSKAVPDSTTYLNKADPRSPIYDSKIQLQKREPTKPLESKLQYDHLCWGTRIYYGGNVTGVYAGQAVRPTLDLPPVPEGNPATWLYAPTLFLSNCCPVESVTIYTRDENANSTTRAWGVYDHKIGNFVVWKAMDTDFLGKYVRSWEGPGQEYFTEILYWPGTDKYYVYLFNFNTGLWECPYDIKNPGYCPSWWGWDMWEIYKVGAWPTLPDIQISGLRVYANSSWQLVNSTYGCELNYSGDMSYTKTWIAQYHQWYVGPTPFSGITREMNLNILPEVTVSSGNTTVTSDQYGQYTIAVHMGTTTLSAHKVGFRDRTQNIESGGVCNFKLIPNAPDMQYVLYCINLWLYPPPSGGLTKEEVDEVIYAWQHPL